MKIALIGTAYPYRGGLAAFNERLANELSKQHQLSIHTFTLQYPDFLFPGKTQYADGPVPEGLTIKRSISSVNPINWLIAGKQIAAEQYDLVLVGFWLPFMGPCLGTISRLVNCPVVAIIHNIIPHEPNPGDVQFARYFCGGCDGFISLTDSVANDLKRFIKQKPSEVSPHPVYDHYGARASRETALAALGLDPSYEYLLFFGLIRDYKGLDLLLEAFADQRIQERSVKLLVTGEFYTDRAPYDQLIERHGIADRVIIKDQFIPDSAVADYFNAIDLLVQPYKTATQSGVTQIAYHFEKPMIVTDVGGLSEMCPDGKVGYVVQPEPKSIADGIIKYLEHTDKKAMTASLKVEKARYDWSIMVEKIMEVYQKSKK